MRTNLAVRHTTFTHEGGPAVKINATQALRRAVLSCLLWEDQFYESGVTIAERINESANAVDLNTLADTIIEARTKYNLRHVPLHLLLTLIKRGRGQPGVADVIHMTIQRADEMGELLSLYWANKSNRHMIPAQMRKGLARALTRFNEYQLAKYDSDNSAVKLRDVLRIVRPTPANEHQAQLWHRAVKRTLATPDTWEVALSGGADKKETFERLLRDGNLGYLALLRNLRNMAQANVDPSLVKDAIIKRANGAQRVFPFRYVAAARAAPQFERELDSALCEAITELPILKGLTIILVDVSGSMNRSMSNKSDMTRMDAAATLAAILPGNVRMFSFSSRLEEVPPRRGMAGVDAIVKSQPHSSTALGAAVTRLNTLPHDRLIVISDEQSEDRVPTPRAPLAYMINVASYKNGVGYEKNGWTAHIDGFSENVLQYIYEFEQAD